MQTDKVLVTSTGEGYEAALEEGTKYAAYVGLNEKQALRLRLLIEETLGMVNAITGDFRAQLWLESKPEKISLIHLNAETKMNYSKKQGLIDASTDKKNAAGKGFMGKPAFSYGPLNATKTLSERVWKMGFPGRLQRKPGMNWKNPSWPVLRMMYGWRLQAIRWNW